MSRVDSSVMGASVAQNSAAPESMISSQGPSLMSIQQRPTKRSAQDYSIHTLTSEVSDMHKSPVPIPDKQRLSAGFTPQCTILITLLIVATMGMLAYGNTQIGTHVELVITLIPPSYTGLDTLEASASGNDDNSNIIWPSSPLNMTPSEIADFLEEHENSTDSNLDPMIADMIDVVNQFEEVQDQNPNITIEDVTLKNITSMMNQTLLGFPHFPSWSDFESILDPQHFTVLNFTLVSSINDFWSAGAYPLAVIIAIWSGVWPYCKLVLLLVIWLCPLETALRKKALVILDQLGKWSFIDLYVLMMMVVSFCITLNLRIGFLVTAGVDVDIAVEIDTGFVIFAVMTVMNMLFSMLFLYFHEQQHRELVDGDKTEPLIEGDHDMIRGQTSGMRLTLDLSRKSTSWTNPDPPERNANHFEFIDCFEFGVERNSELHRWKESGHYKVYAFSNGEGSHCTIFWRVLFLMICIANIVVCFEMLWTAPVQFDIEGTTGQLMGDHVKAFPIIDLINLLPDSTDSTSAAYLCVVLCYLTIVIAPILMSLVIVVLWLVPLNYTLHNVLCHLLFPLQAWNAVDVFLVGAIAASVELQKVSEWILNTNHTEIFVFEVGTLCGPEGIINKVLGEECFSVVATLNGKSIAMITIFVVVQWTAMFYTRRHIKGMHRLQSRARIHSIQM